MSDRDYMIGCGQYRAAVLVADAVQAMGADPLVVNSLWDIRLRLREELRGR